MSARVWHLDMVRDVDAGLFVVAWDPDAGTLHRAPLYNRTPEGARWALRDLLKGAAPIRPDVIVTDHALVWTGIAGRGGIEHQYRVPGERSAIERLARGLLDGLEAAR